MSEERGREVKHNMREGKSNAQARKIKKYNEKSDESSHVDLAPMVDIAFLLLTFFMMTTSFAKPNVFQMGLPEDSKGGKSTPVNPSYVLTINIGKSGKVFMYRGVHDVAKPTENPPVFVASDKVTKQVQDYRSAVVNDPANVKKADIVTVVKIDSDAKYDYMIQTLDDVFRGGITQWATIMMKKEESDEIISLEKSGGATTQK